MINLLPPSEKEELLREKQWKLIIILGILVLAFLICFSLILFSLKAFITGEVEAQKILFNQREKEFKSPKMQTLEENLVSFNLILSKLDSFYQNQINLTEILEKISKTLPTEAYLTNLSITPYFEKAQKIKCNLSGFSPTREKLLEFKQNLESEGTFEEVYFPPVNWVEAKNINFTVTFNIK
jgi:Tfp pilus assembly protein PilN